MTARPVVLEPARLETLSRTVHVGDILTGVVLRRIEQHSYVVQFHGEEYIAGYDGFLKQGSVICTVVEQVIPRMILKLYSIEEAFAYSMKWCNVQLSAYAQSVSSGILLLPPVRERLQFIRRQLASVRKEHGAGDLVGFWEKMLAAYGSAIEQLLLEKVQRVSQEKSQTAISRVRRKFLRELEHFFIQVATVSAVQPVAPMLVLQRTAEEIQRVYIQYAIEDKVSSDPQVGNTFFDFYQIPYGMYSNEELVMYDCGLQKDLRYFRVYWYDTTVSITDIALLPENTCYIRGERAPESLWYQKIITTFSEKHGYRIKLIPEDAEIWDICSKYSLIEMMMTKPGRFDVTA